MKKETLGLYLVVIGTIVFLSSLVYIFAPSFIEFAKAMPLIFWVLILSFACVCVGASLLEIFED